MSDVFYMYDVRDEENRCYLSDPSEAKAKEMAEYYANQPAYSIACPFRVVQRRIETTTKVLHTYEAKKIANPNPEVDE